MRKPYLNNVINIVTLEDDRNISRVYSNINITTIKGNLHGALLSACPHPPILSKDFTCINSFDPHNDPVRMLVLVFLFYRPETRGQGG